MISRAGLAVGRKLTLNPLGGNVTSKLFHLRTTSTKSHFSVQCANHQFLRSSSKINLQVCSRHFSSKSELKEEELVKLSSFDDNDKKESETLAEQEFPNTEGGQVEYTLQLTDEELEQISGGDPEVLKKVKYIQLEHEVYRQEGIKVPSKIKLPKWKELLYLKSPSGRRKFYNYLWLNEMKALSDQMKKQQKREERLAELPPLTPREEDVNWTTYGLGRNSIFLRLYDSTINKFYHNKVIQAMKFSRPLVLDCGFDEFMTPRESKNCAKQIELLITQNRSHIQPFDLYLCNANPESKLMDYLHQIIPTLNDDSYPINITEKSYLDIFPQKELVYLSPHAREVLDKYDEDEIYIVGAMVDKSDPRPFSLAKAKKEKIRMKKLPLDNHLMWGLGTKSLTINQMASIMLDLRFTQDWNVALDHVPRRKLNREFHPYPNQVNQERERPSETEYRQPNRHQSKSQVMQDFELLNKRKGFRRSDSNSYSYSQNSYPPPKQQQNRKPFNVRSILRDD